MSLQTRTAKKRFRKLLAQHDSQALIDLLLELLKSAKLAPLDRGWVLWNLCDRHAILRDPHQQFIYQSAFAAWTRSQLSPHYYHWVVSDATQALNLFHGGMIEAWWSWYCEAEQHTPQRRANRGTRFEAHRAAAYASLRFQAWNQVHQALEGLAALLTEDPTWHTQRFASTTYATLWLDLAHAQGDTHEKQTVADTLIQHSAEWIQSEPLPLPSAHRQLLGSWSSLVGTRPAWAVSIAVLNAACALARAEQYQQAEYLFRRLEQAHYPMTAYAAALALLTRWHNRRDASEIRRFFAESTLLTPDTVARIAPELVGILTA